MSDLLQDWHPQREQLLAILDKVKQLSEPEKDSSLLDRVLELRQAMYGSNADPDVIDDIDERIRTAFSIAPAKCAPGAHAEDDSAKESSDEFEELIRSYGGITARYLEYVEEQESPAQYHFGALITLAAGGIKRRARMVDWHPDQPYPNIYALLVGPSGGRKNAAIGIAKRLLQETFDINVMPSEGTPQGYANMLRRRYQEVGIADAIFVANEFKVLISDERNKKELATWLTDWYDCGETWDRALKADPDYDVRNFYVCVCAGSTIDWLRRIPADAIDGGFMPRFIMFEGKGKRHWKALPKFNKKLEREIHEHLRWIPKRIQPAIKFDPATERLITHWYENDLRKQAASSKASGTDKWFERKQAAVLKTAVVWQILDGEDPDVLHREYVERAIVVIDSVEKGIFATYRSLRTTMEGEATSDILNYIKECGGSASQRAIYRRFREKYRRVRIAEGIDTLKSSGEIRAQAVPAQGMTWRIHES